MPSIDAKKRLFDLFGGSLATTGFYGLADLQANTDGLIDQIYTAPTYKDVERQRVAALFAKLQINVLGEFPEKPAQLPSIAILRASDSEDPNAPIGDYLGQVENETTPNKQVDLYGTRFLEMLEIHVWAGGKGSRMLRDILYLAVRELFVRGRFFLISGGVMTPAWRDGRDGQAKKPEFAPHVVHAGYARITYKSELNYTQETQQITAFEQRVEGVPQGQISVSDYLSER